MASRIKPSPNSAQKIQLQRISHVYLRHVDPEQFLKFATAFGFVEHSRDSKAIYLRGYSVDPYCYVITQSSDGKKAFEGGAFVVKEKTDLDKAMKLPGATYTNLTHLPGGGELVSLTTPGGGRMHLVWGQETRTVPAKDRKSVV